MRDALGELSKQKDDVKRVRIEYEHPEHKNLGNISQSLRELREKE